MKDLSKIILQCPKPDKRVQTKTHETIDLVFQVVSKQ